MKSIKLISYIVFSFLVWMFVFSSCVEKAPEKQKQLQKAKTDSVETQIVNIDTIQILQDETLKEESVEEFPLLVIENCGALWPLECIPSTFHDSLNIVLKAKAFFGNDSLISLGVKGVLKQNFLESYCMRGECGGSQVALKLSNNECFGVLTTEKLLSENDSFKFMDEISVNHFRDITGIVDTSSTFIEQLIFVDSLQSIIIQVGGYGFIHENQWPIFNKISWRIIHLDHGEWIENNWNRIDASSTNLIKPIGVFSSINNKKIIWYHGEGICCPSKSRAWITTIDNEGQTLKDGKIYQGGFGQPCD